MAAGDRNVILAEFSPYDPVAAVAVTVRACSIDDARVTSLNGVAWLPAISGSPSRTLDLFDGEFGGKISAGIGDIELALAAYPNAARYAWGERPVSLWRGKLGDAWSSYTQIFAGLTRPPRASNGRMRIGLRVDDRWLDKPLLSTFAGTGLAEGTADLTGVPKPLALGAPQFIEGVIVNRTLNIFQLHGYGAMNGVTAALDRLSRYGAAAGNDASYAALAAATIAPGAWRTCLALGLVRFGAPPGGVLTFLAQGDSGSALGWVRTPGQVIRRIALIAGATPAQIDTASLAALDAAVPYNISLYLREQTTARDVIQSIAASCNAAAGVSWLGKLFVVRAIIGTPALVLAANGSALPPVASVEMLETAAPFWRIGLEAARTERVHSGGEYGVIDYSDIGGTKPPADATRNVNRGTWAAPVGYVVGDFFVYGSDSYIVTVPHTSAGGSPPPNATVQLFVAGGAIGPAGLNAARVLIFVRAATVPALPTAATTFTFATGALTGLTGGWVTTPPAVDGNPLWVSAATASGAGATDAIAPGDWAAAVVLVEDGTDGRAGLNSATIYLFQRTATATPPAIPAGTLTYTFATAALTGTLGAWSTSLPTSGGIFRWVITATALGTGAADTIATGEWSVQAILAEDGAPGAPGSSAPPVTFGFSTSASLSFTLPAGSTQSANAQLVFGPLTANNTGHIGLEYRFGSGSWTAFGADVPDSGTPGDTLFISAAGSFTNPALVDQIGEVRATGSKTGGGSPPVDLSRTFVRLG